jgi:nucleotide-binding universal stress UspA family protein
LRYRHSRAWYGEVILYKKMLVSLDGSERAEQVLPHVLELALRFQAAVMLISVVEPPELVEDIILYQEETERRAEEARLYLGRLQKDLGHQGVEAEIRVAHGPIVRKILESSKDEEADLIAMASHGRTGLARVFYGSVAAGVLHGTDRPLLLVRSLEVG